MRIRLFICTVALAVAQQRATAQKPPQPTPAASGSPAKLAASAAKVETLVLAPDKEVEFYVSPHGGHMAAIGQKGSRFVVIYDGVEGPRFDAIQDDGSQHRVTFSDDGQRYAYVGRLGQEWVVMVDGKESSRLPASPVGWDRGGRFPDFTPHGKHAYFMVPEQRAGNVFYRLFVDGQAVQSKFPYPFALTFTADGDHVAYVSAESGSQPAHWQLLVDGKSPGYDGLDPRFTADGKHLFTQVPTPGAEGVTVLLDGKPFFRALAADLYTSPAGSGVVAVVTSKGADRVNLQFLVVNGKKVAGSDAATISDVFFSPDGKRYAAACTTRGLSRFMIVDGKKGQEYQSFNQFAPSSQGPIFAFSPDSTHYAYIGQSGGKGFVVVDGVESDGYPSIGTFAFGGNGPRFAFMGIANSRDRSIVVDGKATPRANARIDLVFSPDGSRYAYSFDESGTYNARRLVVDGVVEEGASILPMQGRNQDEVVFVFSPDGKHVVHHGTTISDRSMGFFIDGKFIPDRFGLRPMKLTFTPDGRHMFWVEQVHAGGNNTPTGLTLFVDGRAAQQFDLNQQVGQTQDMTYLLRMVDGTWEMGADGVLTVIARSDNALKRFRVTPPEDTSIDTLLASASAPRR